MHALLDNAIDALKESGANGASLSDTVRARIVQTSWNESTERASARRPLRQPLRWMAIGGVVPVAVMVVASLVFLPLNRELEPSKAAPSFAGAQKVGGAVVFTIADGRDPHRVVRSTDPARFNDAAAQSVTDGRFLDRVNSGPVVVFYRID